MAYQIVYTDAITLKTTAEKFASLALATKKICDHAAYEESCEIIQLTPTSKVYEAVKLGPSDEYDQREVIRGENSPLAKDVIQYLKYYSENEF